MRYREVAENPAEEAAFASGESFLPAVDLMMPLVRCAVHQGGGPAGALRGPCPGELDCGGESNYTHWDMINRLEDVLRLGRGLDFHTTSAANDSWASHRRAMLEFARFGGPLAAPLVPVNLALRRRGGCPVFVPSGGDRARPRLEVGGGRHGSGELLTLPTLRDQPKEWLAVWAASREREVDEARHR